MRALRPLALFIGVVLAATPAHAILLDPTPERILFMGYPPSERRLTVKIVRREKSYGIYAFEIKGTQRLLTREAFVGIVEGSLRGVGLDARAIALIRAWMKRRRRAPVAQKIGPYYRYYFEQDGWLLKVTTTRPFLPTARDPMPGGLISQMLARRDVAARLESLSRQVDMRQFRLRGVDDLRRLGH